MSDHRKPSPCGIVCQTCRHLNEGCAGCFDGGGDEKCHIRTCATGKGITGCWACNEFPCTYIQKLDPAWYGINTGFIQLIKEVGEDRFAALALSNIGQYVEYGDLRFKSPDEIRQLVLADAQP